MPDRPDIPEAAIELLAEHNAIHELWGWWDDIPTREAKEGRQRKRYAQLSEDVKESWRDGAREQLALVADSLRRQGAEEERERLREALRAELGHDVDRRITQAAADRYLAALDTPVFSEPEEGTFRGSHAPACELAEDDQEAAELAPSEPREEKT
ncbi:MAG TPA: hypothetical protein VEP94_06595 [Solirubrobacterales bacterium]|nr:hypothetical protein [Solirubrobacterales bacterium]